MVAPGESHHQDRRRIDPQMNAQRLGIASSIIVHAAVILPLLSIPLAQIHTPRTIQVRLEEVFTPAGQNNTSRAMEGHPKRKPSENYIGRENSSPSTQDHLEQAPQQPPIDAKSAVTSPNAALVVGNRPVTQQAGADGPKASSGTATVQKGQQGIVETNFGHAGAPAFLHREQPVYPLMARRLGKEGKVTLLLLIDAAGRLQNVEIVEAAGFGFTEAAIEAVKKSTYAPASRHGERIASKAILPVRFHLK